MGTGFGVAVALVNLTLLCVAFYTIYTIIVRIPRGIEENTELNRQLIIRLDRVLELLEKERPEQQNSSQHPQQTDGQSG